MSKRFCKIFVISSFSFLAGVASCLFVIDSKKQTETLKQEVHLGPNKFINPLLDCNPELFNQSPKLAPIQQAVIHDIEDAKKSGNVKHVSIYYRDLIDGPQFGINETLPFNPASLLKVPLLIHYMKLAQKNPTFLQQKVVFHAAPISGPPVLQNIAPSGALIDSQEYSLQQLLDRAILQSDNLAAEFLAIQRIQFEGSKEEPLYDSKVILKELGLNIIDDGTEYEVTVKDYASIFRILYHSTFLDPEFSNKALEMLSKVEMVDALRKGVPENIPVSHKFGERIFENTTQFHDCGIVYHPTKPYLLCVMTRGSDMKNLIKTVAVISKTVFTQVDQNNMK